ncbi:MAG: glucose-6-phosphate isomerase [Proteobacteria bacterium]|nr:glucose-6-phosphate isomerase [Pseudomonadota bacterium]
MPDAAPLPASATQPAWDKLAALAAAPEGRLITPLFAADPKRPETFSASFEDMFLDISKTSISPEAMKALFELARAARVEDFIARLFAGEPVNMTEHRSAMHMALRSLPDAGFRAILPDGSYEDASKVAAHERDHMEKFVRGVHDGSIVAADGRPFTDVLNIGIGGSDLGPRMVSLALTFVHGAKINPHFLSNVDGHAFAQFARELDPARTLVLVASKTFTTLETMTNGHAARDWLAGALGEDAVHHHFAALSTNLKETAKFGISEDRVFGFRDWVGGRYSVWSAIGLSVALAAGWDAFEQFLAGGRAMDEHFRSTPLERNLPALLALAGIWNLDILGAGTLCILAYDARLARFPAYLQQLEMESNGKSTRLAGDRVTHQTCPVVFGEPGTDAQHSFMQLVHQGPALVPVDFILAAEADHDRPEAHRILAANVFAQAEALLEGKTLAQVTAEMEKAGEDRETIARVAPHRVFTGERPSTTILYKKLDPYSLGRLIVLYEHKVAVQGAIWGINSYDQWGVELGKKLAQAIIPSLEPGASPGKHDGSTTSLMARFKALRGER